MKAISFRIPSALSGFADAFSRAASSVLFAHGALPSVLVWTAIFVRPVFGLSALAAVATGWVTGRITGFSAERLRNGALTLNCFLVGLAAAWMSTANLGTERLLPILLTACVAGALALWTGAGLERLLTTTLGLPLLSSPFVIVGLGFWILATSSGLWNTNSGLFQNLPHWQALPFLPELIREFLSCLGAIFFLPVPVAGALLFLAVLCWSRFGGAMVLAGYAGALAAEVILSTVFPSLLDLPVLRYNAILCGMAFGCVYLIPGLRSLGFAIAAGLTARLVAEVWMRLAGVNGPLGLPIPFLFTTWALLLMLRSREHFQGLFFSLQLPGMTPEEGKRIHTESMIRFPYLGQVVLRLPFRGQRVVTQSFDGEHTHRGLWKHGLDFEVLDDEGNFSSVPHPDLNDCFTWGSEVLSPAAGIVRKVVSHLDDNPVGHNNFDENWGNRVLVQIDSGGYILLAHFKKDGILVMPGQQVAEGQLIGHCGNSGRSTRPHLHMHYQLTPEWGAPTAPFLLYSHLQTNDSCSRPVWRRPGVPQKGSRIEPVENGAVIRSFVGAWREGDLVFRNDKTSAKERVAFRYLENGDFQWKSMDRRASLLGTVKEGNLVLHRYRGSEKSVLAVLALGLARLPLIDSPGMQWQEPISVGDLVGNLGRLKIRLRIVLSRRPAIPLRNLRLLQIPESPDSGCLEVESKLDPAAGYPATSTLPKSISTRLDPFTGPRSFSITLATTEECWTRIAFHVPGTCPSVPGASDRPKAPDFTPPFTTSALTSAPNQS